jgi:hypothetical protein
MLEKAKDYNSQNPVLSNVESANILSGDSELKVYISAGKEHSARFIDLIKKAYHEDINASGDIDPKFLKNLHRQNMKVFLSEVVSKRG